MRLHIFYAQLECISSLSRCHSHYVLLELRPSILSHILVNAPLTKLVLCAHVAALLNCYGLRSCLFPSYEMARGAGALCDFLLLIVAIQRTNRYLLASFNSRLEIKTLPLRLWLIASC
jgi:hypothetical protein